MIQEVLLNWRGQLEKQVSPYLEQAVNDGFAVQVVLNMDNDGKVEKPKIIVMCNRHRPRQT